MNPVPSCLRIALVKGYDEVESWGFDLAKQKQLNGPCLRNVLEVTQLLQGLLLPVLVLVLGPELELKVLMLRWPRLLRPKAAR